MIVIQILTNNVEHWASTVDLCIFWMLIYPLIWMRRGWIMFEYQPCIIQITHDNIQIKVISIQIMSSELKHFTKHYLNVFTQVLETEKTSDFVWVILMFEYYMNQLVIFIYYDQNCFNIQITIF